MCAINRKSNITIAVTGSFSTGKTTVINSLLGEDVLYTHALPDLNNVYEVIYGEKKEAILNFRNPLPGKLPNSLSSKIMNHLKRHGMNNVPPLHISYDELKDHVIIPTDKEQGAFHLESPYENVMLLLPHPTLKAGIAIIDMPGLTESYSSNNVISKSLEKANYILFVFAADHLCSNNEMELIEQEYAKFGSAKMIFAINRMDLVRDQDVELIKKYAEQRLSAFTDNPIFYISEQRVHGGLVKNADSIENLSNFIKQIALRDIPDCQLFSNPNVDESSNAKVNKKKYKEYHINNSTIKIIFGNILDSQAEVIVSSDDCNVTMGGGVSMAIRQKEGTDAIRLDVKKKIPADIGDVVVSTAGTLPQKNIFHVITIGYNGLNHVNLSEGISKDDVHKYIIGHSIDKCFQLLHAMDMTSIAFPQIGAGVAGIPFKKVAEVMAESIGRNLRKTNKAFSVEIYLYDRFEKMNQWDFLPMFEQFSAQEAISKMLSEQASDRLFMDDTIILRPSDVSPDMDNDIFISYSRKDAEIVKTIYEWLEKTGYKCWLDVDGMFSGVSYKKVIVDAIKRSKILLFMSSENSNKSRNVVSEVSIAVEYGKKIIPVRLDMSSYSESIEYDIINHDYVIYDKSRMEESNREMLKKIVSTLEMI